MERRLKTHPNQWAAFIDFAEKNSIVLTKKMEGPFGKERYEKLWNELTDILNSMGYLQKSKDKWQKAVADWKSKTRAKASDIKIQLSKTGGGGQGRELSEIEKRLIGIIGWTAIRGDGTSELGSIPSVAVSELQEVPSCSKSNQFEHSYSFQVKPSPLRNVEISPPPLLLLEKNLEKTTEEEPLTGQDKVPPSVPSKKRKNLLVQKQSPISSKWKVSQNLEIMHRETLNVLKEINGNLKNLADSQKRMCTIQEQYFENSKKSNQEI